LGLIVYAIVALVVQREVRIDVPFCEVHRNWRTRMNLAGSALLIGSVRTSILLGINDVDGGIIALVAIGMAGLVVLALVGSSFKPVYIDANCARVKGSGEQFLSLLPNSPVSL
jgi:hypothetical protein